ncbi:MAG: TVP38/TMEM64 family protein [Alphaproteobacteria bacterium]|nr:TVP38/TMEM64 family protein [Alphaproteobacteria bacterium]
MTLLRWTLGSTVLVLAVYALSHLPIGERLLHFIETLRDLGPAGMAPFALSYAIATVFLLPSTPFPLAAGFLYGPWAGFVVAWSGEVSGALAAWWLGRTVLRRRAERLVARSPVLTALGEAIQEGGLRLLFLVRLSPIFPFGPLNYSLGLFDVPASTYLVATAFGVGPACLFLTWTGSTLPRLQAVLEGEEGMGSAWGYWVGLLVTAIAVIAVTRATRQALNRKLGR